MDGGPNWGLKRSRAGIAGGELGQGPPQRAPAGKTPGIDARGRPNWRGHRPKQPRARGMTRDGPIRGRGRLPSRDNIHGKGLELALKFKY